MDARVLDARRGEKKFHDGFLSNLLSIVRWAALLYLSILDVQVLPVLVSGRTLSRASYFLRKCGSSPVKVANF